MGASPHRQLGRLPGQPFKPPTPPAQRRVVPPPTQGVSALADNIVDGWLREGRAIVLAGHVDRLPMGTREHVGALLCAHGYEQACIGAPWILQRRRPVR